MYEICYSSIRKKKSRDIFVMDFFRTVTVLQRIILFNIVNPE